MKPTILIISCEHGSNKVPKKYANLFEGNELILQTPRAFDVNANHISNHLHKTLGCELVQAKITRLLIDCNHSLYHRHCFSKFSKRLPNDQKIQLIKGYYEPFHHDLEEKITQHIAQGHQVLHLSFFTFTPILHGIFLNTAISVLYDAHRHAEKEVVRMLHGILNKETPPFKIRHNYPYLGAHTYIQKTFRDKFPEQDYLGIKLGINQALTPTTADREIICNMLGHTLHKLMEVL
jgi:predicted N-formylglutamate amidohydrolase